MIVLSDKGVKDSTATQAVKFKSSQYTAPKILSLDAALEAAYGSPEYHLGTQFFYAAPDEVTAATPYRYWCVLDFDDAGNPAQALRECFEFIITEMKPLGLEAGKHYSVAVSGTKGCKVFFRHMPFPTLDAPKIWASYISSFVDRWPTIDKQVAFQSTLGVRFPGIPKIRQNGKLSLRTE